LESSQDRRAAIWLDKDVHILLVEDEPRLASAVRRALQEEGHVVDWVADGDEALAQATIEEYDALVLDVMLPGRDGFSIARTLRQEGSRVPILMLTARDAVADRVAGLDAGADDYLVKPFALSELLARVRALGRRSAMAAAGEAALEVGDLKLDLLSREAMRGGRRIELTAKEFALLELLMRHPGQVLTRSQLLDRVWSYDAPVESNVLETYIHYLRRKIDHGFETKLIRTVRGAGYAIRAN
jgi:DNA-binding response OmpR family regulator